MIARVTTSHLRQVLIGFLFLVLFAALFLWAKILWAYLLVLAVPGIVLGALLPDRDFSLLDKLFLIPFLGAAGSVLLGSVLSLVGIPLTVSVITVSYIVFLVLALAVILLKARPAGPLELKRDSWKDLPQFVKDNWHYLVLGFIVMMGIVAKVFPGWYVAVPPLHDPAAHAIWAKSILDTGRIQYFYAPGLHILLVFSTFLSSIPIPKHLVYITNFYNAYVGVGFFIFIMKIFRNRVWAVLVAAMFTFGYYPAMFYTEAGKNALVVDIALLPVAMLAGYNALCQKEKRMWFTRFVLPSMMLGAIFLVHYPSVFTYGTFLLGVFFYELFRKGPLNRVIAKTSGLIKDGVLSNILGVIIVVVWAATHSGYYAAEYARRVDVAEMTSYALKMPSFTVAMTVLSGLKNQIQAFDKSPYFFPTATFLLGGFVLWFIMKEGRFLVSWFAFFAGGLFFIEVFRVSSLWPVSETAIISFFVFVIMGSSALFAYLYEQAKDGLSHNLRAAGLVLLLVVSVFQTVKIHNEFIKTQDAVNVVTAADLHAMKWIDRKIPKDAVILNNAILPTKYLFGTDAGYWIPAYTNRRVAMSFVDQSEKSAHENFWLYSKLKERPNDIAILKNLAAKNIHYIYIGARSPFGAPINKDKLTGAHYQRVYADRGVYIYRIVI